MKTRLAGALVVALLLAAAVVPAAKTLDVGRNEDAEISGRPDELSKKESVPSNPLLPPFLLRWVNGDWDYWSNAPHLYTIPEGNVGIGTDTPTENLHVKGDLNYQAVFESIDAAGGIGLRADTGQAYGLLAVPADHASLENYFVIHDVIADQTRLSIDKTGNIIINTPGAGLTFPDGTTQTTAGGGGGGGDDDWQWATGSGINGDIYHMGKVGIGTWDPESKLDVNGNIDVNTFRVNNYYGFPRPDYDSGWVAVSKSSTVTLTHNIGGNPDDYVVDLIHKSNDADVGRNNIGHGGLYQGGDWTGTWWGDLTSSTIKVTRNLNDNWADSIRVRIWVYE